MKWSEIRKQREKYVAPSVEEQVMCVPLYKKVLAPEGSVYPYEYQELSLEERLNAVVPMEDTLMQDEVAPMPMYDSMDLLNRVQEIDNITN